MFPILPNRSEYLTHLVTESKCDALVYTDEPLREACKTASRCLGVPLFNSERSEQVNSTGARTVIQETQPASSLVPSAVTVPESQFGIMVENNKRILSQLAGPIAPLSRNWFFDAETVDCQFPDDRDFDPRTVIVESTADLDSVPKGVTDIVVDSPQSLTEIKKKFAETEAEVKLRFLVPELGPVADLASLEQVSSEGIQAVRALPGFLLETRENRLWAKRADSEVWFRTSFSFAGETVESPKKSIGRKRKIMQPDWRVRKVPLAVYHKKRGFKGQIYYTTKHKGWTFYRSRYYN